MSANQQSAAADDDARWAALRARDAAADGTFVYSVKTTGVYCRPSCPARPARPENVAFHATPAHAARAGFRPCKRCKPDQPRLGGLPVEIRFATGRCTLGVILAAASPRGLCAVLLGDEPGALVHDLAQRFPRARLHPDKHALAQQLAQLVARVDQPRPHPGAELPLDLHGTAFQQRVWKALCRIPAGSTATYAEIARQIGAPRAVRAVAQACAANALAVAIPCHRVVRSDGQLSGYRWGVERKRALLDREAGCAAPSNGGPSCCGTVPSEERPSTAAT